MRNFAPLALAVVLAGCISAGPGDPRVINVEASAAPAGTTLTQSMNALVDRTGPAYVTVIVHEAQQRSATSNNMLPNALTSGSGFLVDGKGHVVTAGHVAVRTLRSTRCGARHCAAKSSPTKSRRRRICGSGSCTSRS